MWNIIITVISVVGSFAMLWMFAAAWHRETNPWDYDDEPDPPNSN